MSEESERNRIRYQYKYIQFSVTSDEKKRIKRFAQDENFKTTSEFIRRILFDYIRRQENPDLFSSPDSNTLSPLLMERINNNIREVLRNQEVILQREDKLEEMREMVVNLHRIAEVNSLSSERESVIGLLNQHSSLSLRQIQEGTNLTEDVIFKILSDMNLFKITTTGRFALR